MEWLDKLQVPGLILAGFVIWMLFKIIQARDELIAQELSDTNKLIVKMSGIVDLICAKTLGLKK